MDKLSLQFWLDSLDPIWKESIWMVHPGKDIDQAAKESWAYLMADPKRLQVMEVYEFKRFVNGWLSNKRTPRAQPVTRLNLDGI